MMYQEPGIIYPGMWNDPIIWLILFNGITCAVLIFILFMYLLAYIFKK